MLHTNNLINAEEFEILKRIMFLRNLIALEYYRISTEELLEIAKLLEQTKNFVERVKKSEQN